MSDGGPKQPDRKKARKHALAGILTNAARTTGRAGSTELEQSLVELRCKHCGAPRQQTTTFVCEYCGSSLV